MSPLEDSFPIVDLERSIAEERRAQVLNVAQSDNAVAIELASSIRWLVNKEALYHYTTPAGLIGILTEKKIRATSLLHMSDASELTYARDLYREIIFEIAASGTYSEFALTALYLVESQLLESYTLFAACFCREGDLLSQWREYGGGTGGFAVGMDLQRSQSGWDGWEQLEVIYDREQQRRRLIEFFLRSLATLSQEPEPPPGEPWPILAGIQKEAVFLMASLKHPAFEAEREVRLVQWRHKSLLADIRWRNTNQMIVPYVEFLLSDNDVPPFFGRPPVVDIVIGPTNDETTTRRSLDLMLEEYGYTFRLSESVRVRRSKAPLRTR